MDHSIHVIDSIKMKNSSDNSSSTVHQMKELVTELRTKFLEIYDKCPEDYDPMDVQMIKTNDYSIKRFLTYNNLNTKQALIQLIETMKWRKSFGIKRDYSLCGREVFETGAIFINGQDRENRPVLYVRVKTHVKIPEFERIAQDIVIITMEKLDQMSGENGFTVVMDVNGAGLSNVDLKAVKFMITAMRKYYPDALKSILVVNLPFFMKGIMPFIRLLLGPKYSHMLHTVTNEQLHDYINPDYIPKYLGGNSDHDFTKPPEECKQKTEELAHLYDLSPTIVRKAIKKFDSHIIEAKILIKKTTDLNGN